MSGGKSECSKVLFFFFFVIIYFDLIMSSRIENANKEEGQNQSFILQAMQQHFARFEVRMNNMRDRIEQNEEVLRRILPQTQRQERRIMVALNHKELENELKDEEEYPIDGEALDTRHVLSA